jgi:hypothetical protein
VVTKSSFFFFQLYSISQILTTSGGAAGWSRWAAAYPKAQPTKDHPSHSSPGRQATGQAPHPLFFLSPQSCDARSRGEGDRDAATVLLRPWAPASVVRPLLLHSTASAEAPPTAGKPPLPLPFLLPSSSDFPFSSDLKFSPC